MRVTQRSMYNSMLGDMQSTLSAYMESVTQGASQKRLNRPSDDPAGAARVLSYRASLTQSNQHVNNSGEAEGWLSLTDSILGKVQIALSQIREQAGQAATDTYDADQRMAMAMEVREFLGSLMNMANTEYDGRHIFGGEKYSTAPYQEGLTTTLHRAGPAPDPALQVSGSLERTAMVRFGANGTVPPAAGAAPMDYSWSVDGGKTWTQGVINAPNPPLAPGESFSFPVGSSTVTVPNAGGGNTLTVNMGYTPGTVPLDPMELATGSTIDVRPAMIYQGSDNNGEPTVTRYGTTALPPGTAMKATGKFANDTLVRFDSATPPGGGDFTFSYSNDGGATWITGNRGAVTPAVPPATVDRTRLVLPGGFVDINLDPGMTIAKDAQLSIKPQRTSLEFEILEGQSISVNNIGKDIFGGLFKAKGDNYLSAATGKKNDNNVFETVGRLVAALETNDKTAVGECFEELKESEKNVVYHLADVGGKRTRVTTTLDVLEDLKIDQRTRMSAIEDVDFTELMTNLAQQQTAYNTVLKSSSMIMQLNLMKFM